MGTHLGWRVGGRLAAVAGLGLAFVLASGTRAATGSAPTAAPAADAKYVGSAKCKNCHSVKAHGDQFGKWKEAKHSHAYETLGTPAAAEAAKAKGITDPQNNAACLKCHETAYGEPAEKLAKGFDPKEGVGCEVCHGPGEAHMKARMAAAAAEEDDEGFGDEAAEPAMQAIPAGEIVAKPGVDRCVQCHNKESPSFKPFCMKERAKEIAHFDPRRKRTPEQLDCKDVKCLPDCEKCKGQ